MEVLKELHGAIATACEASFDKAYKDLESIRAARETEVREAEKNALNANETRQAAEQKIEDLQREIAALREELHHYEHGEQELQLPEVLARLEHDFAPKQIWDAHPCRPDQLQQIFEDKYTTLYTNLQTFVRSWSSLKAKVLQHKKKLRHWDKQLERDEFTLLLHGGPVTFRRVRSVTGKSFDKAALSTVPTSGSQTRLEVETTHTSCDAASTTDPIQSRDYSAGATRTGEDKHAMLSSKQQDPNKNKLAPQRCDLIFSESSSDALHLLPDLHTHKRKRTPHHSRSQSTRGETEQSVPVKNEPMSSSPVQLSIQLLGQPLPSTQDLDEVGDTVQTPTKHRASRGMHGEESPVERETGGNHGHQLHPSNFSQQPSILQPVDGNARAGRLPGQLQGVKRQKRTDQRALMSMAEDGDFGERGSRYPKPRSKATPAAHKASSKSTVEKTATQQRLQGLLDGSLPMKSPLASTKSITGAKAVHAPAGDPTEQKAQKTDEDSSSQHLAPSHGSVTASGSQVCPEVCPENEPYRSLPIHRLNLDHFKINPARNQGLDYAYDTVVRKKDERKCISGCTRPGCCGDRFRAMARLGGLPTKSTTEQEQEDRKILEEYVGDDRHLLEGLNAQDREDLLVEARARTLANQYGRHRHNHQRARTPPGFWRTDMPDTQDLRSDREAAQRLEREKVEERYREAMRPGGLWTWADE